MASEIGATNILDRFVEVSVLRSSTTFTVSTLYAPQITTATDTVLHEATPHPADSVKSAHITPNHTHTHVHIPST